LLRSFSKEEEYDDICPLDFDSFLLYTRDHNSLFVTYYSLFNSSFIFLSVS
jgi:hypothetical protein